MDKIVFLAELILLFFCIGLSAFFSSSEMALFSLSRAKIMSYKNSKSSAERKIYLLMNDYRRTLIAIILGNMFVNSCISMLNNELLLQLNLGEAVTTLLSAVIAVVILLLFGEITPMTVAHVHCNIWSVLVSPFIYGFQKLLLPVITGVSWICEKILIKLGKKQPAPLNSQEYLSYLDSVADQGLFNPEEADLLKEVLRLREKVVEDVMQSRVDLVYLQDNASHEEAASVIRKSRQAFLPVSDGQELDQANRLLSTRVFFNLPVEERKNWLHSPAVFRASFLPDHSSLPKALAEMKRKNLEVALVADEYGGINGMLTLQDIYSEIAGKSVERNSNPDWYCLRLSKTSWIFDGMSPMDFVLKNCPWEGFDPDEQGYESNTLNGIFCEELGALPEINESVSLGNTTLTALSVERNRITKIRVEINEENEVFSHASDVFEKEELQEA